MKKLLVSLTVLLIFIGCSDKPSDNKEVKLYLSDAVTK